MKYSFLAAFVALTSLCYAQSEFAWSGDTQRNFESRNDLFKPGIQDRDVFWKKKVRRRIDQSDFGLGGLMVQKICLDQGKKRRYSSVMTRLFNAEIS